MTWPAPNLDDAYWRESWDPTAYELRTTDSGFSEYAHPVEGHAEVHGPGIHRHTGLCHLWPSCPPAEVPPPFATPTVADLQVDSLGRVARALRRASHGRLADDEDGRARWLD